MAVPAESMELSVFGRLNCGITNEDNIRLGYSYFFSEVLRVRVAAEFLRGEDNVFQLLEESHEREVRG
jgi:hypothetical protein